MIIILNKRIRDASTSSCKEWAKGFDKDVFTDTYDLHFSSIIGKKYPTLFTRKGN
jgi:hypothetical protein